MIKSLPGAVRRFLAQSLIRAPALQRLLGKSRIAVSGSNGQKFVPNLDEWIHSHYYTVVDDAAHFCGDIIRGKSILNVGCGEMLTDFGLLRLDPHSITGIDISPKPPGHLEQVRAKLAGNGIQVPPSHADKLSFVCYDGENFPFADGHFELIFSWSAFEHVANVPRVLAEISRVLKPGGHAFVQVYPWFHCLHGSHLTDWIAEPYFQLRRPVEWVRTELERQAALRPAEADFILGHMFPEYRSLNKKSARQFYAEARNAGFQVIKAKLITYEQDLSAAPADTDFADLMIFGTMMLLKKP
ncbi:MAG: hypothetical protein JWO51_4431 [Rhodospirillales bacterium]|nr:hypothetical protein [Rhodospirillales bacterium]